MTTSHVAIVETFSPIFFFYFLLREKLATRKVTLNGNWFSPFPFVVGAQHNIKRDVENVLQVDHTIGIT